AGIELDVDGGRIAFELGARVETEGGKPDRRVGRGANTARHQPHSPSGRRQRTAQTRARLDRALRDGVGNKRVYELRVDVAERSAQIEVGRQLALNLENGALRAETKLINAEHGRVGHLRGR